MNCFLSFFLFFFCRGLEAHEKPSVIKTESLGNDEPNFNQTITQDNATSDITSYNNERASVKTATAASVSSNNCLIGNTRNISENKGQMKQQARKVCRGVEGVITENSYSNWGIERKKEKVCNQEFLDDDDDDILAAVTDDDYFVMEEDFDMEQIDQLEMGTQNTTIKTDEKTTSNMINYDDNDLEMFYDDPIFEDDFVEEDFLAEATDTVEIKPLHESISNEGTTRTMHNLKKERMSNSSSLEFSRHARNTLSSSNNTNIQIQSDGNSRKLQDCISNSVKTEPVLLMNNSTINSCNIFINTGQCYKPKDAVAKSNVLTNPNNLYTPVNQISSIQIKNEPENESIPGLVNDDINAMVVDTNHHQPSVHNVHGTQGNIEQ